MEDLSLMSRSISIQFNCVGSQALEHTRFSGGPKGKKLDFQDLPSRRLLRHRIFVQFHVESVISIKPP